jgi:hypothetical protein
MQFVQDICTEKLHKYNNKFFLCNLNRAVLNYAKTWIFSMMIYEKKNRIILYIEKSNSRSNYFKCVLEIVYFCYFKHVKFSFRSNNGFLLRK